MGNDEILARRERIFGRGAALFYDKPVHIVRGEGAYLYDADGKEYIDLYNNVPCVGHANPHVAGAMARQAATLNVHSRYLHEGILEYGERLLSHHHDGIESVVFACSGTEANEIAIMMARIATGGRGIICTDAAYHGNSAEVSKMSRTRGANNDGDIRSIPFPEKYRPIEDGLDEKALCDRYIAELVATIDRFGQDGIPFAGLLVCPIFANEGLPDVPAGYMSRAAEVVRRAGGVVICDEVQAGVCRTGKWWGYEVAGFVPEIVSMGKPLGNGLPLSAAAASRSVVEAFRERTHYFNTFASSPLQGAVGAAVLDVIEGERLWEQVTDTGNYLVSALEKLTANHPKVGDVRGCGLFVSVEWVADRQGKQPDRKGAIGIANSLKDKGFLLSNAGAHGNVVKVRPPLVFGKAHADKFLTAFEQTLKETDGA